MKNRLIKSILVALFVLIISSCMCVVAFASDNGNKPTLSYTPVQVEQGDTFTTTIYIEEKSNVCSMGVKFLYDKDALTLVSCVENESSPVDAIVNTSTEGEILITFANGSNINSEIKIVDVTFKVNDYLACGSYTLLALDSSYTNTISSLNSQGSANSVSYSFDEHKLNIYRAGDFNLDGTVNEQDAVYILRYEVGLKLDFEITDFNLKIADIFANGTLGIDDAVNVLRYVAELDGTYGNRVDLAFFDQNGQMLKGFSVKIGDVFNQAPELSDTNGYKNGKWMVANGSGELVEADFTKAVTEKQSFYASFEEDQLTDAMKYFVGKVSLDHLAPNSYISSNQVLKTEYDIGYGNGYIARVSWESTNESILNSKGEYSQPAYESSFVMKAKITVYKDGVEESFYVLEIPYKTQGKFKTPAKAEVEKYLKDYIGTEISTDLRLPKKVTNDDVQSSDPYEIRLEWYIEENGVYVPISQIKRGTEAQIASLQAILTFNGTPLEGDGKVYFDDVVLTAVTEAEIRAYIVNEISKRVAKTVSDNYAFWSEDERYDTTIAWKSGDNSKAVINNNVISVDQGTINGDSLMVTAEVTYGANKSFTLNYEVSVSTSNQLLVGGVNIDEALYNALIKEFNVKQLSIATCKGTERVSLDLSAYPEIESLNGIQYCENLRYINVSGLKNIADLTPIASLNNLEVFIASDCGLDSLTDTGSALFQKLKRIVVIDLSNNSLEDLSSVLDPDTTYSSLVELYLNDNEINDASLVKNAPFLQKLELANNSLTSASIENVSWCQYLNYLSLANNEIDNLSALSELIGLKELRLQENNVTNVEPIKNLTSLQALYLGDNELTSVDYLYKMRELRILYLNNNAIEDIGELDGLTKLNILNISNNKINSLANLDTISVTEMPAGVYDGDEIVTLSRLEKYDEFTGLTELYADNNEIDIIRYVVKQTNLVKLTLADNFDVGESNVASTLKGLVNLKTLTLSGKTLNDLSFLENMTKLERLELASCKIPSYILNQEPQEVDGKLQVTDYNDNIKYIASLGDTLKYLDISNNPFEINPELSFVGSTPYTLSSFDSLYRLVAFYANNVDMGASISVVKTMSALKYISLENSNISTDLSLFANKRNYVYINLAENNITSVDLSKLSSSKNNLKYLYLDTTNSNCSFVDSFDTFMSDSIEELSLRNVKVASVEAIPEMNNLKYLDMYGNTISDFEGRSEIYSISRFTKLDYLDVGGNDANVFLKENLNTLYDAFNGAETVYLYSTHDNEGFDGDREALKIKSLANLTPFTSESSRIQIHTMYNKPHDLCEGAKNYEFNWYIEENEWFGITDNVLSVVGWDMRQNNVLAITTDIDVYTNDGELNAISFNFYTAPSPYNVIKYTQTAIDLDKSEYTTEVGYFNVPLDNDLTNGSRTDYTFNGWYSELYGEGVKIGKGTVNNSINVDGSVAGVEVYAKWLYTVTFDPADGECNTTSRTLVSNQAVGTLPNVTKDYFLLAGWKYNDAYIEETTILPGHTTVVAVLVREDDFEYPVDFVVPYGKEIGGAGIKIGVPMELPTPESNYPDYYTFVGWMDKTGTVYTDEFILTEQVEKVTLTAVWEQVYEDWYYVKNRADLEALGNTSAYLIMLIDDIDLSGKVWEPIDIHCARFEGNNFTISNMTITGETSTAGLFSGIGLVKDYFDDEGYVVVDSCYVRNINLENVYINVTCAESEYTNVVAGFCGSFGGDSNLAYDVSGIDVQGEIIVSGYAPNVGGIFGSIGWLNAGGSMNGCSFKGNIIVNNTAEEGNGSPVGGIAGTIATDYYPEYNPSCYGCHFEGNLVVINDTTFEDPDLNLFVECEYGVGICEVISRFVDISDCSVKEGTLPNYNISFVNPDGEAAEDMTVTYGSLVDLPIPTRTNYSDYYTLRHWVDQDGNIVDNKYFYIVKKDITLTAVWKQTYEDYIYVKDEEGIEAMSNGKYMIIDDIYLFNQEPIPTFTGEIQGNGFTIYGSSPNSNYYGLILEAKDYFHVYNLNLSFFGTGDCGGSLFEYANCQGALVAEVADDCDLYLENVDVTNCGFDAYGSVKLELVVVGGLIGHLGALEDDSKNHIIVDCDTSLEYSIKYITTVYIGGIVGTCENSGLPTFENCSSNIESFYVSEVDYLYTDDLVAGTISDN